MNIESGLGLPRPDIDREKMERVCNFISHVFEARVSPERVKAFIERSNQGGYLYHGIKTSDLYDKIKVEGVRPMTPEGEFISCWTSGTRIFLADETLREGSTYDSTFFHYSHSYDPEIKDKSFMTIAITNKDQFSQLGAGFADEFHPNQMVSIKTQVPPQRMMLLRLALNKDAELTPRHFGVIAETALFQIMEEVLESGLKPGETTEIEVNASDYI